MQTKYPQQKYGKNNIPQRLPKTQRNGAATRVETLAKIKLAHGEKTKNAWLFANVQNVCFWCTNYQHKFDRRLVSTPIDLVLKGYNCRSILSIRNVAARQRHHVDGACMWCHHDNTLSWDPTKHPEWQLMYGFSPTSAKAHDGMQLTCSFNERQTFKNDYVLEMNTPHVNNPIRTVLATSPACDLVLCPKNPAQGLSKHVVTEWGHWTDPD